MATAYLPVLGSGATATLIEPADVVVDQWYHFRIDCMQAAPLASTYQVKIDGAAVTTVTGAVTDYELGIISVLGTDLHACDECGIKNIRLITDDDYFVGRTALDQVLQDVKGYVDDVLPTGSYIQFAGSQAPAGFLVCNGGEISRTTYSALFAVIGTTYGSGDGSTTFNVPNLNDGSYLKGAINAGIKSGAVLPSLYATSNGTHAHTRGTMEINGSIYNSGVGVSAIGSGALQIGGNTQSTYSDSPSQYSHKSVSFTASRSWTGETSLNGAHTHTVLNNNGVATGSTVEPKNATVRYIIKE